MEQTECVTKVELHISCRGLMDKDVLSKSDPIAVVLMQDKDGHWFEYARTERVKNNLNPDFSKSISLDYYFEMVQKLKFAVYDVDNESTQLNDDDFLGGMECTLGQVVSKKTFPKELEIKGKPTGLITVCAEEVSAANDYVKLSFSARDLDNKDFLGKSDPFLEISRMKSDGGFMVVHRTEVIKNNLNPNWKPFEMTVNSLCGGNYDAKLKIDVYDHDEFDSNDFIGSTEITLKGLLNGNPEEGIKQESFYYAKSFELINPKKQKKKKKYANSGQLVVNNCEIVRVHTFLEYVMGGCQINFSVGVDFTISNGSPSDPTSLHYMNPQEPNQYIQALMSVGEICQDYDTDKLFPAFGFGAAIPPRFGTSHAFPLNFNKANPQCEGILGVVAAYQACLSQIQLSAPTNAAPIINQVADLASEAAQQTTASQYFILLMLTDGELSDMTETKLAVIRASSLPMSVIIVGVGSASFSKMQELDADMGLLSASGKVADRDIVQFVPFRDFKNVGVDFTLSNGDPSMSDSLHYMNPQWPNQYTMALMSVGEICQDYDTDKLFPAFGFGARIPPEFQTSHAFPLNFNEANPQCEGILGVVAAYQSCLSQIQLSLPTNAAPIINQVADLASEAAQQTTASQYFILLMLTDGALSDMTETKSALIRASSLPMSVIIVGVGMANFSKMEELDADEGLLSVRGRVAERDIVQFVPFKDFQTKSPALLAQHVLAEVPKQVQDYFNKRKIQPLNPKGPSPP